MDTAKERTRLAPAIAQKLLQNASRLPDGFGDYPDTVVKLETKMLPEDETASKELSPQYAAMDRLLKGLGTNLNEVVEAYCSLRYRPMSGDPYPTSVMYVPAKLLEEDAGMSLEVAQTRGPKPFPLSRPTFGMETPGLRDDIPSASRGGR